MDNIKGSITIWMTVSEPEYHLLNFTLADAVLSNYVTNIVVLVTGPKKPLQFGSLEAGSCKIKEYYQDFGNGFDIPVGLGGFNQIEARNTALMLAEQTKSDWLIQVDADDYYSTDFYKTISLLDDNYDAVRCSSINLLSEQEFWDNNFAFKNGNLVNPHIRAWRSVLCKRFKICSKTANINPNFTGHCGVDFSFHPKWKIFSEENFVHFHLHGILGKRNTERWQKEVAEINLESHVGLMYCIKQIQKDYAAKYRG